MPEDPLASDPTRDHKLLAEAGLLNRLPGGGLVRKASSSMAARLAQQKWLMDEMLMIDDEDSVRMDSVREDDVPRQLFPATPRGPHDIVTIGKPAPPPPPPALERRASVRKGKRGLYLSGRLVFAMMMLTAAAVYYEIETSSSKQAAEAQAAAAAAVAHVRNIAAVAGIVAVLAAAGAAYVMREIGVADVAVGAWVRRTGAEDSPAGPGRLRRADTVDPDHLRPGLE